MYPCNKILGKPTEYYKNARLVFVGRVVKTELSGDVYSSYLRGLNYPLVISIKAEESWKGAVVPNTVLYVIASDNCGDKIPIVGYRYVFFTYQAVGGEEWKALGKNGQKIERIYLAYEMQYEDVDEFLKNFRFSFGKGKAVR